MIEQKQLDTIKSQKFTNKNSSQIISKIQSEESVEARLLREGEMRKKRLQAKIDKENLEANLLASRIDPYRPPKFATQKHSLGMIYIN